MTSEIRSNTLKNRVGLGTVSFTNTGPVVSGIVTANTLRLPDATSGSLGRVQFGNGLHLSLYHNGSNSFLVNNNGYLSIQSQAGVNGIFIARNAEVNLYFGSSVRLQTSSSGVTINRDLDVDGHTNLDNVSIAGVSTFSDDITLTTASGNNIVFDKSDNQLEFGNDVKAEFGVNGQLEVNFESYSGNSVIKHTPGVGSLVLHSDNLDLRPKTNVGAVYLRANYNDGVDLYFANSKKFETTVKGIQVGTGVTIETNGQATYTGIVTATSFSGDGSSLSNLPAGAPVGGASTNTVFFENDTAVAVNYQITSGKNAMSAGPIAINAGIAVTVPSGSSWTIV